MLMKKILSQYLTQLINFQSLLKKLLNRVILILRLRAFRVGSSSSGYHCSTSKLEVI